MNADDARIAHLMGQPSDALDDGERDELDGLADLLADPSVWAMPPDDLEGRVVQAVSTEAAAANSPPSAIEPASPAEAMAEFPSPTTLLVPRGEVVDLGQARGRRASRRWTAALGATAAAAAVAVVAVLVVASLRTTGDAGPRFQVALAPSGAPGPSGSATLSRTDSGWNVVLDVDGLPRLDGGKYYQAWLKNAEGVLVPLGSFNEGGRITLWSGVSPIDFPGFTVTGESADGNQASSGIQVLAGTVDTSPHPS